MHQYKVFVFNFLRNKQRKQFLFPQHKVDISVSHILPPPYRTSNRYCQYDRLVRSLGHYQHTCMLFQHYDHGTLPLGSRGIPTSIHHHMFFLPGNIFTTDLLRTKQTTQGTSCSRRLCHLPNSPLVSYSAP